MIQRGREKQHVSGTIPGTRSPGRRRRGLWAMIGFSLVIFVVIVIFETQHELARQRQIAAPEAGSASRTQAAEATAAASVEPVTLLGRLKEHYRSHDLPRGWTVAGIVSPTNDVATVRIVFSPSPQDSRYGQSAPAADVAQGSFCPEGSAFWSGLEDRRVTVELGDKGGALKTIECGVAGAH